MSAMKKSYTKNYLKIYVTQFLSITINLLSLIIVIPYLTGNSEVYGIYSLCVSMLIFLSYADLGFLNAGYKYASEYHAKNDTKREIEVTGFVAFILLCFVVLFAITILVLSYNPAWLIKNIKPANIGVARNLLLILAVFCPNMVLQRMMQIIFGIRVEDFLYQRIQLVVNIIRICGVFLFTNNGHYNIVGYFLFYQAVNAAGSVYTILYASKRYKILLKEIITSIKFSKPVFDAIRGLAFSSLFFTVAWVLFYELDPYVIAKLSGAQAVAFYSIGLSCQAFFRTIFSMLFNPFNARFNHFIALKNFKGLRNMSKTVMSTLLPAVVFPVITLAVLSKPFVFSWVGANFSESTKAVTLLALCSLLQFINLPAGYLVMGLRKIKLMYALSYLKLIIYWLGIALLFPHAGYIAFGYMELTCFMLNACVYTFFLCRFLKVNLAQFIRIIIWPAVIPVIILMSILFMVKSYLPLEKGKLNLLMVVAAGIVATGIAMIVYYFTSFYFRNYTGSLAIKMKQFLTNTLINRSKPIL
jgi:O-antigen/teichoic acid export membrane protein